MSCPTYTDLKMENKQPYVEKKESAQPKRVPNKAFTMAMLTTLSTSDIVTTRNALSQMTTNANYLPPPSLQVLEAVASNQNCGNLLLMFLLKGIKTSEEASKVLSVAAHNKVLYQECIEVLLKHVDKVTIDRSLVKALAEQPNGKACLKKIFEAGKEIEFDEWEKGYVINVVRESFGHAVLGEMVDKLGIVACSSKLDGSADISSKDSRNAAAGDACVTQD